MKPTLKAVMVFWIWGISLIIFSLMLYIDYNFTKRQLFQAVKKYNENVATYTAGRLEDHFITASETARLTAIFVSDGHFSDREVFKDFIKKLVVESPEIYGFGAVFSAEILKDPLNTAPYYYEKEGRLIYRDMSEEEKTGPNFQWYRDLKDKTVPCWSEPYISGGRDKTVLVTYAQPIIINNRFQGTLFADLSLEKLSKYFKRIRTSNTGYIFLISPSGRIIWCPDKKYILTTNLFDKNAKLAEEMTKGEEGLLETADPFSGESSWVAFRRVPSAGYTLGAVYPKNDAYASLKYFKDEFLVLGSGGMLLLLLVIILFSSSISSPVTKLSHSAGEIARGNLSCSLPGDAKTLEVSNLQESFRKMTSDLKNYLEQIRQQAQEQQKTESELNLAREIQMSVMPSVFPPFPRRDDLDVYAETLPARKVGGDFYDFYLVDEKHLAFVIGDASGKGVPAAIFMAVFRSIVKSGVLEGLPPHLVIQKANELICREDYQDMFITVFLGILDTDSGILHYCNGGHNYPYLLMDGNVTPLKEQGGPAPGISGRSVYKTFTVEMGQKLFLYTDGVTEAINENNEEFGNPRLEKILGESGSLDINSILNQVKDQVEKFKGNAPQFDDITMMAVSFRRNPPNE